MPRRFLALAVFVLSLAAACSDDGGPADPAHDAGSDAETTTDLGRLDASPDHRDASTPNPDASTAESDASTAEPDASTPEPDASIAEPDASTTEPDAGPVGPCGTEECENYSGAIHTSTGPGLLERGVCRLDESDEHEFVFPAAGVPAADGTLRFQWLVASGGFIDVYTRVGAWVGSSPHNVGHAETSVDCGFVSTTFAITRAQLAESLDGDGNLVLKYRIVGNAPPGAGCAYVSDPCMYNARLAYPLATEP